MTINMVIIMAIIMAIIILINYQLKQQTFNDWNSILQRFAIIKLLINSLDFRTIEFVDYIMAKNTKNYFLLWINILRLLAYLFNLLRNLIWTLN